MNLAKYGSVFNIGLQNTFVYRWNYFLRALFGLIPLAGTVFLWRAIFQEPGGKSFGGYDYGSMIYYYLLTILVSNLVTPTEDDWQIAADIREGQINSFLTKPLSYLGYRTGIFLAGRLVYTAVTDRKSTRLNSSHSQISYAVFCLKKNKDKLARARMTLKGYMANMPFKCYGVNSGN